ncbi:hypothetical protein AS033_15520 [Exiguobacterium indicum]|uniref:Uncharacterized protein n=1 Tax=Exiguobacterium indicum TaxID=296995 RepID=A0A0V8GBL4_9BACL|nr:hypothetical protein [Exiguobacterium enclense]KSU47662.1 hypothetical protein AS033_15520 [Exiguobacterium enclense]SDD43483.1 hypothetical protein SAMN05216342_3163 [Exiguobacterium enclense]
MKLSAIIALIISLPAVIISGMSLLSKTNFESIFLTHDQILKKCYLKMGELAFSITYLATFIYVLWIVFVFKLNYESIDKTKIILIAMSIFFIAWILLILYSNFLANLLVKNKTMYKVFLEGLGEVYILKMLNHETCICSKDAHANLNNLKHQIYLVRIEDLIKLPLTQEIVSLPSQSFYQKLFS